MKATHESDPNGDVIKVKSTAIDYALRIALIVIAAIGTYAALWLKVNAPTRDEFNKVVENVQGMREDMLVGQQQIKTLVAQEDRIRALERDFDRMFPNRRRPNE